MWPLSLISVSMPLNLFDSLCPGDESLTIKMRRALPFGVLFAVMLLSVVPVYADEPLVLDDQAAGADMVASDDFASQMPANSLELEGTVNCESETIGEDEVQPEFAGDFEKADCLAVLNGHRIRSGWVRLWGRGALDTMSQISKAGWDASDAVVIASNAGYWDALAANSLAGALECPVLLTDGNSLSGQTREEIRRLGSKIAYICGGPNTIDPSVEAQLRSVGCSDVRRLCGARQNDTAIAIASIVRQIKPSARCIIATSETFHDALSAASYAYASACPILTCKNGANVLSRETLDYIKGSGFRSAVIVGGHNSVASSIESVLSSCDVGSIERLQGPTAYETSLEIARWCIRQGMEAGGMGVATGSTFHDALSGAALCGINNAPIVIADNNNRVTITDFVSENRAEITGGYVFGGPASVSDSVYRTLEHCWANGYSADYATDEEAPYRAIYNYEFYRSKYPDVAASFGNNRAATLNHFLNTGRRERRQGCAGFDVRSYYNQYEDLRRSYGVNWPSYYEHYRSHGEREGRAGTGCTSLNGWQFHNVPWQGQPNGYYCGPTSGTMILASAGASWSASGSPLNVWNLAKHMRTDNYGFTSFHDRMFQAGMNSWLGRNAYTTIHTPSYDQARDAVLRSYDRGLAAAVDAQERRGGPHFNGHNNGTFSHIMVVDGYNNTNDRVVFADPGARVLWAGAQEKFEYPSLNAFITTYCQNEIMGDGRQHIGMFAPL